MNDPITDPEGLADKLLKSSRRSTVWAHVNDQLPTTEEAQPIKTVLNTFVPLLRYWEDLKRHAAAIKIPRRDSRPTSGNGICRGCGVANALHHDRTVLRRHLFVINNRRLVYKSWRNLTPEQRRLRTLPARMALQRKILERKLAEINPRVIKTLGRDATLKRLQRPGSGIYDTAARG